MPLVDLGFSEPCGPDFVTILSFSLFIVGPSAEYLPGGNADGLLSFVLSSVVSLPLIGRTR